MENENAISLKNIERLFKRWLKEEIHLPKEHLREGYVLKNFVLLIKGGELSSRVYYAHENYSYHISMVDFYTYMNTFSTYTDFFAKHFEDFMTKKGLEKKFIHEVNRIIDESYDIGNWPERLRHPIPVKSIKEYVEQRKTTGFMCYITESFSWIRAEDTSIQWSRVCADWRKYIVDILIENARNEKN